METLIFTFVGALVTWAAASYYYKKASKELQVEAAELRRLNNLMLHGMEYAGWIEIKRDNSGKILGFNQTIKNVGEIPSEEAFGTPTIVVSPPKN